ncbi:hypothetical protein AMS62_03025 [Bacillus sp. FJAT-18019]|nr:hypothetical protein AMS62_03025 [Bacillus sp. FJAT-18019]
MKLYTIIFTSETGTKGEVTLREKNKITAVNEAFKKIGSWRAKDKVVNIEIIEDVGNEEATASDYNVYRLK